MKKKIIFSDLIGTILPADIFNLHYLYGQSDQNSYNPLGITYEDISNEDFKKMLNKAINVFKNYLTSFLHNGNFLYIVTDLNRHDMPDIINKMFLFPINERLSEYKENIHVFVTCNKEYKIKRLFKMPELIEFNDNIAIFNNSLKIHVINSKDEVFKYVPNLNDYNIYAIGDSCNDLPMLIKCMELGGIGGFIYPNLYLNKKPSDLLTDNLDYVITKYVNNNHFKELDELSIQNFSQSVKLLRKYKEEIYKKIRNEEIDFSDLVVNNILYELLLNPHYSLFSTPDKCDISTISNLVIVSTFLEFLQKQSLSFEESSSRTLVKNFLNL